MQKECPGLENFVHKGSPHQSGGGMRNVTPLHPLQITRENGMGVNDSADFLIMFETLGMYKNLIIPANANGLF